MAWFVAISDHMRQRQAVDSLLALSFPAYAPTFLETIVRNGRKVEVSRFLFGHYLFIKMMIGWEATQFVRGLKRVLLSPKLQPLLMSDEVVDSIKSREVFGAIRVNTGLCVGQRVTPRVGHLQGIEGRFLHARAQRDVALFNILGEETPVEFAPGVLEVLDPIKVEPLKRRRSRRSGDRTRCEHAA